MNNLSEWKRAWKSSSFRLTGQRTLTFAMAGCNKTPYTIFSLVIRMLSPRQLSVNRPFCLPHLSYGMFCQDISGNIFLLTLLRESWRLTFLKAFLFYIYIIILFFIIIIIIIIIIIVFSLWCIWIYLYRYLHLISFEIKLNYLLS